METATILLNPRRLAKPDPDVRSAEVMRKTVEFFEAKGKTRLKADYHARAKRLAEGLAARPGVELDPATVETNIVIFAVPDAAAFTAALAAEDVEMSQFGPTRMRAVTHLDVDDAGIDRALAVAARALG